jgi:hypothetical protein
MTNLSQGPSVAPRSAATNRKIWRLTGACFVLVGVGVGTVYFYGHNADSAAETSTSKVATTGQSQIAGVTAALPPSEAPKAAVIAGSRLAAVTTVIARPELTAVVKLANNKTVELTPNALGLFPRVLLDKEQTVPISLSYPDGEPGEVLVISAEDGGQVNSSIPVQTVKLDENRQVNFRFTTTQNEGVFRVTLRRAAEQQQFDFWVGPEPVLQTATPSL